MIMMNTLYIIIMQLIKFMYIYIIMILQCNNTFKDYYGYYTNVSYTTNTSGLLYSVRPIKCQYMVTCIQSYYIYD